MHASHRLRKLGVAGFSAFLGGEAASSPFAFIRGHISPERRNAANVERGKKDGLS